MVLLLCATISAFHLVAQTLVESTRITIHIPVVLVPHATTYGGDTLK